MESLPRIVNGWLAAAGEWLAASDPLFVYPLGAAVLLAAVALTGGLARGDVRALLRPPVLVRVLALTALAFAAAAAADYLGSDWAAASLLLIGAARLPLYIAALAYGPSAGLLAGALFSPAVAAGAFPGVQGALLTLELLLLGWLAIFPSPRSARYAGPLLAPAAHALTLLTAGVAHLVWLFDAGSEAQLRQALQAPELPGLAAAWLALYFVTPARYARYLPGSRIAPGHGPREALTAVEASSDVPTTAGAFRLPALGERSRIERGERELTPPRLDANDPNS